MLKHLKKLDWWIIISSILLVVIGLISLYSSSSGRGDFLNFKKQIIFFFISLVGMIAISFLDWRSLRDNPYIILIGFTICILLLLGLFFFAQTIHGVKSWYRIGPLALDPVEITKIILIVLLAKYFSTRHIEMYRLRHILLSGFYVLLPAVLVFKQPNMGSALILVALWIGVLIISGIKLRHFLILILCGILLFLSAWFFFLKDYQKSRVVGFLNPQVDPLGISWNQTQAKIAIGSGGIFGQGFGKGSQTRYGFLPEPQTDFIFAAIAEEGGFLAVFAVIFLFVVLLWRITKIAVNAFSNFPRLFASGFAVIVISQIFVNIGMNLGLLPVIGISLPFVSYGGSGLITLYAGLGFLQSIKNH